LLLSPVFFFWLWTPHLLNFCIVFFKMDPEYSDALELGNWTVGGSARLGEAATVVPPTVVSSPMARHYPPAWSTVVPRPPVISFIPRDVVPAVTSYESPPFSPSTVPVSILDSLQALNQTVGGLIRRVDQQEHSVPRPQVSPQPPVIQIYNGVPGFSEAYSSSGDPALVGGVTAAVIFFLLILGAYFLRRFFPNRWKTVRDAVMRVLRAAAVPISWLLHQLGDLSHRFGASSESDTVSH
jgi:hypothetical protein